MSDPLRVGIIGCGATTQAMQLSVLASLSESFTITHVFDQDAALANRLAARTGAASTSLDELLTSVDVVGVHSSPNLRARHVVAACSAGVRGVLVDLPIGLTAAETRAAQDAVAGTKTAVVLNAFHLHDPAWQQALRSADGRDLVLARLFAALGPEAAALAAQTQPGPPPGFDADAIYSGLAAQVVTGGLAASTAVSEVLRLMNAITVQELPLVRTLFGGIVGIEQVTAFAGGLEVQLRAPSGALAHLTALRHELNRPVWRCELVGAHSSIRVDFPPPFLPVRSARAVLHDTDGELRFDDIKDNGYRGAWRAVQAAVLGTEHVSYGLDEAALDHELMQQVVDRLVDAPAGPVNDKRKAVVYGAGVFGALHASVASARGTVVRVLSRSLPSVQARAALVGADAAEFDAPHALDHVDVAIVSGVPRTHAAHALRALEAKLPVLVEKPLTGSVGEARALVAAVERTGTRFVYGENWAFRADVLAAVDAARRLDLTEIEVTALWMRPPWGDYLSPEHGGGVLYDAGAHAVELARLLLGRPQAQAVSAELRAGDTGVDIEATVDVSFEGGRQARIHVAWGEGPMRLQAIGKDFSLELSPAQALTAAGVAVELPRASGVAGFLFNDGIVAEHEALTGDGPVRADVHDGLAVTEITAAAYLSAASGRTEPLPFAGDETLTPHQLWTQRRH
jgi:predicted dehydrogenase